jgi:post-segregation antitoxin (ccd killing protein)
MRVDGIDTRVVNVNAYLPDDLGKRAKDADLPFSQLLRDAVVDELERREAMAATLADPQTFKLAIEDRDGTAYTGRIKGKLLAADDRNRVEVYLTEDERVILYDGERLDYWAIHDPQTELEDVLETSAYVEVCRALGIEPVIDL